MNITTDSRVGIIGGKGKTGSQFANLFRKFGCNVDVTGSDDQNLNPKLIAESDIVIFSVPLEHSNAIIEKEIAHATREDQLVLDLSSLKLEQVERMLLAKGEVIGMHPLFGPTTNSDGQTIVLCPERCNKDTLESLRAALETMGMKVRVMTSKAHDELMAYLQVIPHLKSFLVADALKELDADIDEIMENSTPAYSIELDLIGRFLDDSADLYGPIIFANPKTAELLDHLDNAIQRCKHIMNTPGGTSFSDRYCELQSYFGKHCKEGREHSEKCIDVLTNHEHS